jgi:hypothetical protein
MLDGRTMVGQCKTQQTWLIPKQIGTTRAIDMQNEFMTLV